MLNEFWDVDAAYDVIKVVAQRISLASCKRRGSEADDVLLAEVLDDLCEVADVALIDNDQPDVVELVKPLICRLNHCHVHASLWDVSDSGCDWLRGECYGA